MSTTNELSAFDDFNGRGSWEEVFAGTGWIPHDHGKEQGWSRPDHFKKWRRDTTNKTKPDTIVRKSELLILSEGIDGLDAGYQYLKADVYGELHCAGDYTATAKALHKLGYGKVSAKRGRPKKPKSADLPSYDMDGMLLPEILVTDRQARDISSDAYALMTERSENPSYFAREGDLVRTIVENNGKTTIHFVKKEDLRSHLGRLADFRKRASDGSLKETTVPDAIVEDILSHYKPFSEMPQIVGISPCVLLRKDGSWSFPDGYDEQTGYYINACPMWPNDEMSGPECTKWFLEWYLGNFPFVDDASRATILALALLPFLRAYIDDLTPLHLFTAPAPRTGKTLAIEAALIPGLGSVEVLIFSGDPNEMNSVLLSALIEGQQLVFFDNVKGHMSSPAFEAALTSRVFSGRIKGLSKIGRARTNVLWVVSGNNATQSTDMVGRTILSHLDAKMESPGERDPGTFAVPNLKQYAYENRSEIAGRLMRIVQHWVDAGCPEGTGVRLGGFERWSAVMDGVLRANGITTLDANRAELKASADVETEAWESLFECWYAEFQDEPKPTAKLVESQAITQNDGFISLIGGAANPGQRLGNRLGSIQGRIFKAYKLQKCKRKGAERGWQLVINAPGVESGTAGMTPNDTQNQCSMEKKENSLFSDNAIEGGEEVSQGVTPPPPGTLQRSGGTSEGRAGGGRLAEGETNSQGESSPTGGAGEDGWVDYPAANPYDPVADDSDDDDDDDEPYNPLEDQA